ncbi:MAG TPA: hypothetical protein VE505_06960 [Vicinamibacterales bacterium]|nr:hypothetical protein [Vicinamibacterales bacterium]
MVVVDEGMGKSTTTNTLNDDVYAFIFSQKGLMAGHLRPDIDRSNSGKA